MDFDRLLTTLGILLIGSFIGFLFVVTMLFVTFVIERSLMLDCLNNGGHWLTNYAIGCTYPMG